MTREERDRLLASHAMGGLTEAERRRLMEAALHDQELFEALYEEEPLRQLLSDPAVRGEVLAALEEPTAEFEVAAAAAPPPQSAPIRPTSPRRWWYIGAPAALAVAAAVMVAVIYQRPKEQPVEIARVQPPAEPQPSPAAQAPPPASAAPAILRREPPREAEAPPAATPVTDLAAEKKNADEAPSQQAKGEAIVQVAGAPVHTTAGAGVATPPPPPPSPGAVAAGFRESDRATLQAAPARAPAARAMSKMAAPEILQGPPSEVESGQPARVAITAPADGRYRLVRLDARGEVAEAVWTMEVKAGSTATVELGILPPGVYRYRLEPAGAEISFRVR